MRHSITMYGCTYGHAVNVIAKSLTSPVMTGFFILSGFSIHYAHRDEEISSSWIRTFLTKRFLATMPTYLLVVLLWPIVYPSTVKEWGYLLPVDLLGIQTMYRTLFGILHNGGTWFVSCIIFCYASYPIIKAVLESNRKWTAPLMMLLAEFLLMYSYVIIPKFSLDSLYSNPIARIGEFMIGVAFSEIVFLEKRINWCNIKMSGFVVCLSIVIATIMVLFNWDRMGFSELSWIYYPMPLIILLLSMANHTRGSFKLLAAFSGIAYQFFLAQLFLWRLSSYVLSLLSLRGNIEKISISFILCTAISFLVQKFYDKPCRKFFGRCFL